jgi:tRNA (guanine37-N1)-methyltransferase
MKIDIVTLFPRFFESPLDESLLKKARERGLIKVRVHNVRDYTHDKHQTADAKPFGGGAGMLMKPEPVFECVEAVARGGYVVLLDARGERLTPELSRLLARKKHLVLIAGHYEGVDYRVAEHLADRVVSVGDFVTMGGEAPALCLIESVVRWRPGVIGNRESLRHESFHEHRLEYPQYTRPRSFRGWEVPAVLLSGDHTRIESWRREMSEKMTSQTRPDLEARGRIRSAR